MKETSISAFSKVILGLVGTVAIVAAATAVFAAIAEKNIDIVKSAEYRPKKINAGNSSLLQGGYWELEYISVMTDSVETEKYTLITDIMEHLPDYGASYYYSFTDDAVLSLMPVEDPGWAIDIWKDNVSGDFWVVRGILPFLEEGYRDYRSTAPGTRHSKRFESLCESVGIPFPSIVVTGYDWFRSDSLWASLPSDPNLKIADVGKKELVLAYGKSAVLRYVRIERFRNDIEIAPATLYFKEKDFFMKNHDRLADSKWRVSDEKIDEHFRKTFKSRKY